MQSEILEQHPDAEIEVYAVWFNMFPGDDRKKWPEGLLTDSRVHNYWDEGKTVGRLFGEHVTRKNASVIEWDAFILFGPEAEWGDTIPQPVFSWGRTIVGSRKKLMEDFLELTRPR